MRASLVFMLGILTTVAVLSTTFADQAESGVGSARVEGFRIKYKEVATPKKDWGAAKDVAWVTSFQGEVETKKPLSYRGKVLAAGIHDAWVEKGKGEWLYLYLGDRNDSESERVRAMFKLYEQEQGVEEMAVEMKLTRRATKLKFSIRAGKVEGHCNFKILGAESAE